MFAVGISVGLNHAVFRNVSSYGIKIFLIPFGIIADSVLGGLVCVPLLGMSYKNGVLVASGLGWYSFSGVVLTDLVNAQICTIAFMSDLMREIISFLLISIIAHHLNYYTAIAPAASTSEDTTLPTIMRYTNKEIVVIVLVNGVFCSTIVPLLIGFFYQI